MGSVTSRNDAVLIFIFMAYVVEFQILILFSYVVGLYNNYQKLIHIKIIIFIPIEMIR